MFSCKTKRQGNLSIFTVLHEKISSICACSLQSSLFTMQILSEFDIFSIVGFNKPLQVIGARAAVKDDGILRLRFEGVFGNPIVSGICVRRAPKSSGILFCT